MQYELVKSCHGYVCLLLDQTTVSDEWKALQRIRPTNNPVWWNAMPLDGGTISIQEGTFERLGVASEADVDKAWEHANSSARARIVRS